MPFKQHHLIGGHVQLTWKNRLFETWLLRPKNRTQEKQGRKPSKDLSSNADENKEGAFGFLDLLGQQKS